MNSKRNKMDSIIKDIRYGLRSLLKRPGFTIIALIALALGIGANTAIFSLVNAVVLQPLPYQDPDRLVWAWGGLRNISSTGSVSPVDYLDYRSQNKTFEHLRRFRHNAHSVKSRGSGDPERLSASACNRKLFRCLWCASRSRSWLFTRITKSCSESSNCTQRRIVAQTLCP